MAGVLVLQKNIEIENYRSTISISELHQGVFLLEILTENDKNLLQQKIIKL